MTLRTATAHLSHLQVVSGGIFSYSHALARFSRPPHKSTTHDWRADFAIYSPPERPSLGISYRRVLGVLATYELME